jgi:hypothetical protein
VKLQQTEETMSGKMTSTRNSGGGGDMTTLQTHNAQERRVLWGGLVRSRLCSLNLSAEDLRTALAAAGSPVTIQAIHKWLRGAASPTEDNRDAIARVLFSTTEALFPRSPR